MRIALTGATGFIGRHCVRYLERTHRLALLVRSRLASDDPLSQHHVVRGDLHDTTALAELVDGADALVHIAGAVRGSRYEDFARANVEGLGNVIDALGSARLVLISSQAASRPHISHYAQSKHAAEELVRNSKTQWTILRPVAVYGPGDVELKPLFDWLPRGLLPSPATANARFSIVHVDDVARATQAAVDADATFNTFTVQDNNLDGYTWRELADCAENKLGRNVRVLHLPWIALSAIALGNQALGRAGLATPMLTPGKLRELRHPDWVAGEHEAQRLRDALGFAPVVNFGDGISSVLEP